MAALDGVCSTSTYTFTTGFNSYDVFLNFRGEDTRNNFIAFLNLVLKDRGINVFIDSEKLWTGEAIGPACLRAIAKSKILIPVFSKGYANSKWCLLELAHIHQCHISNHQMVLPIFFDVEPWHVRNQIGSFGEAFREHEKNFEPHIVESWREALRVIGNLKGEVIDKNKDQAKIVELIVKRALDELISCTHLAECKYPIGIDSRIEDLLSLLNNNSNDVQFVGICGVSGIGKTTIAKVVYNRILSTFNRHSFLSDIKEQAKQCMGLAYLQKRLLKDIFKTDFDIGHYHRGTKLIEQRLCEENVLLVLDDVDSKEQIDALAGELHWFGQGSRVIITTRDKHILNMAKIDKDKIYCPQEMDHEKSLQLFSLHAFSMDEPPQDYMQLSHDVVCYLGGLPSTLKVLGSYLSDISSKEEWKSTLRKLKAGKTSVSSIASLRTQRKNTCPMKYNPLGWRPSVHGTIEISTTVTRVSKVLGGCLDLNGFTATIRVGKRFTTTKNQAANFTGGNLNPNGSTATERFGRFGEPFRMQEMRAATKNFDKSLMIGCGGFGTVYKGVLNDGTPAAFKRHNTISSQGREEFEREIEMLSKLRHINVVSMIGFCKEKDEMILAYEYMANGALRKHLLDSDLPPLTWKQRLEICIGAARGLHYLHTWSEIGIIHLDVKTTNILLDENFVAKIADFGLSRTGSAFDDTHDTYYVRGTYGFIAPEYAMHGQFNKKCDVYSFGVVLIEVACGGFFREHRFNLIESVPLLRSLETVVDRRLEGNYSPKSLKKFGKITKKCIAEESKNRPTMGEVLQDLEYALQLHEAWLASDGEESTSSSSSVSTIESNDDTGGEEEYSTCSSLVGAVGCDDFSDLVNPQGR
ncbi:uncharacterized protein LOC122069569 [Macadamia integrifolia]|uniref:uncharacterized protein LOC122069569 n=1 Tax=Macadamia integrifolia TaxID=60698 RepID=UPI001C500550|nr:uncharacterized protein LOC122069569 [Macadamia integrifolia]